MIVGTLSRYSPKLGGQTEMDRQVLLMNENNILVYDKTSTQAHSKNISQQCEYSFLKGANEWTKVYSFSRKTGSGFCSCMLGRNVSLNEFGR